MLLKPKSCYTWHKDVGERMHLAIITNPDCFFVEDKQLVNIPADGHPYIVDCGLGVTRQFVEAGYSLSQVDNIFLTHHHSDHNLEFGPLVHTLWTSGTSDKVDVYGPEGTKNLLSGFLKSLEIDIKV